MEHVDDWRTGGVWLLELSGRTLEAPARYPVQENGGFPLLFVFASSV